MDDLYAINVAKSEIRDCFNFSDVSRLLAISDPDLVNFSHGYPCEFGLGGLDHLRGRLEKLFEHFTAKLEVIVMEIRIQGDVAYDYGWQDLTLTPKAHGQSTHLRTRYVDIWRRNKNGDWRLWMYMDNPDVADPFSPEQTSPVGA